MIELMEPEKRYKIGAALRDTLKRICLAEANLLLKHERKALETEREDGR
ncbi:MAG: hypothetical protein LBJ41_07105 [Treponema sp.]|jgi:hypothetical protein|nr:hypothetical protein [Treponema sp.]